MNYNPAHLEDQDQIDGWDPHSGIGKLLRERHNRTAEEPPAPWVNHRHATMWHDNSDGQYWSWTAQVYALDPWAMEDLAFLITNGHCVEINAITNVYDVEASEELMLLVDIAEVD